jgi:hypothetical protein
MLALRQQRYNVSAMSAQRSAQRGLRFTQLKSSDLCAARAAIGFASERKHARSRLGHMMIVTEMHY